MKKILLTLVLSILITTSGFAQEQKDLPDVQYYGYKITHHMGAIVQHLEKFGFNKFDHPPMPDHRFFVITPALDHFYSKAVIDTRWGPVIVDTPARDDRYGSLLVTDMEHFGIYAEVTDPKGQRFVLIHENYKGPMPKGTVIKTKSNFPLIFLRTQTFAFNEDKLSDGIRRQARIYGAWQHIDLPNEKDPQAIINWTIKNSKRYSKTKKLIKQAAKIYTSKVHKETFENVKAFLASGGVSGNVGMFEALDDPAGGSHKVRAAGTLMGHLGFPVYHAYYQQIPVDGKGVRLSGANGPFVMTLPYKPGVDLFWSVTRYGANTFLPLNPADLDGNNIQAYNAFNTKPDKNGNVTFTFSKKDPKDGTYWMPVTDSGYYIIARYYGPTSRLNGNTAKDIVYGGTPLEKKFETVKFK
jgi:hypothetical protein